MICLAAEGQLSSHLAQYNTDDNHDNVRSLQRQSAEYQSDAFCQAWSGTKNLLSGFRMKLNLGNFPKVSTKLIITSNHELCLLFEVSLSGNIIFAVRHAPLHAT